MKYVLLTLLILAGLAVPVHACGFGSFGYCPTVAFSYYQAPAFLVAPTVTYVQPVATPAPVTYAPPVSYQPPVVAAPTPIVYAAPVYTPPVLVVTTPVYSGCYGGVCHTHNGFVGIHHH